MVATAAEVRGSLGKPEACLIDTRSPAEFTAKDRGSARGGHIMLCGGAPLDGPRHVFWNFVSSRRDRINQAKEDWKAGRFALPPDDHDEYIPLPEVPLTVSYP